LGVFAKCRNILDKRNSTYLDFSRV